LGTTECLDQRIPDAATLRQEVVAWKKQRNCGETSIDWRFKTDDARTKLNRLYLSLDG
jgi:hypothetical protein